MQKTSAKWPKHTVMVAVLWAIGLMAASEVDASPIASMRGYAETRYTHIFGTDLGSLCYGELQPPFLSFCDPKILVNRLRPSFLLRLGEKASLRATLNVLTSHFRLDRTVQKIEDILTIDRLYMDLRTKYVDLRAGKQSFQWGPAQLWSLTIPYNPQDPTDLNAERPGLWALTGYISYSTTGGVRLALMAAPDMKNTLQAIRWNHTFGTTEVALTSVHDGVLKRFAFGADIKGQWEVGLWLEAALYVPYEKGADGIQKDISFAAVAGVDYTFRWLDGFYIALQYHYNHAGISDPAKYPFKTPEGLQKMAAALQSTASSNNITGIGLGTGFLGAHYLLLMLRLTIYEDLSVSLFALSNLIDPSVMFGPSASWTFLTDFVLTIGAYFFLGPEGSEFNIGRIKVDAAILPKAPLEGLLMNPHTALFAWLRYNF